MRIFALELNNDIKGMERRDRYVEDLIGRLPEPDLVVLPELSRCSYMASQKIWAYADDRGRETAEWAVKTAEKYKTYIGVGYLDRENGDYYNRYLLAGPDGVCGIVSKSEGESAVFKRGDFGSIISAPFGRVAVGICDDSRRKHIYDNIKNEELSLILFPHGAPADPKNPEKERAENDKRCRMYVDAFGVPVVYVNSVGSLEFMPGMMGAMMKKHGFRMNGMSRIYAEKSETIAVSVPEGVGAEIALAPRKRRSDIRFCGEDILPGNRLFKYFILNPDIRAGIRSYEANRSAPL